MKRWDLTDRVAVITGGGGGLGSAVAQRLLAQGARVALLEPTLEVAERAASQLGTPDVVRGWAADVRDSDALEQAFAQVAEHFGGIDIVVANAAVMNFTSIADEEPADFQRMIDINLVGVWRTIRAAIPHLEARGGYVLAVASMSAFIHQPVQGTYSASKAGVVALVNIARQELAPRGIGAGLLYPTFFDSPMTRGLNAHPAAASVWGRRQRLLGLLPSTSIDRAADRALVAIVGRKSRVSVRRDHWVVSRMPGLFQSLADWAGWSHRQITDAVRLVNEGTER